MGRQTYVALTDADERPFLEFLRASADIRLLRSVAPARADTWVDGFSPRDQGHWQYYIWNSAFPWTPVFGTVSPDAPVVERRGWVYVSPSEAPLIEYDRHNFETHNSKRGRVYWARPHEPSYDVEAFSAWFDRVVRWLRANGRQQRKGSYETYFLPDAWRGLQRQDPRLGP